MIERLTNRTDGGIAYTKIPTNPSYMIDVGECYTGRIIDHLAAYDDSGLSPQEVQELTKAKQEGRLIVLPCKIGEKVYRYCNDAINEGTIINILLNVKTGEIGLEYEMPTCYTCSRSGALGKNLFLTREEAEKALKGVSEC